MLVSDLQSNSVLRFHVDTGAFWDTFVLPYAGGLDGPWGTAFGPNRHEFLVASSNSDRVIAFNASTGAYIRRFCDVPSPRGLALHSGEIYVCSSRDSSVHRFNGRTGAPRGILVHSALLQQARGIVFNPKTNRSLVASQQLHHLVQIGVPSQSILDTSHGTIWSSRPLHHVSGVDISEAHAYAVSPYAKGIMQYNLTTGQLTERYQDDDNFIPEAFDVKHHNMAVYVCGSGGIQKYFEWRPLFLLEYGGYHVSRPGMRCTFLFVDTKT